MFSTVLLVKVLVALATSLKFQPVLCNNWTVTKGTYEQTIQQHNFYDLHCSTVFFCFLKFKINM